MAEAPITQASAGNPTERGEAGGVGSLFEGLGFFISPVGEAVEHRFEDEWRNDGSSR